MIAAVTFDYWNTLVYDPGSAQPIAPCPMQSAIPTDSAAELHS